MTTPKILNHFILIGSPVAHSLSPILHNLFATQFRFKVNYELHEATVDNYLDIIYKFINHGGLGINITAPLKTIIFKKLQYVDKYALCANAVNTLIIKPNGSLHGYNTDGVGLIRDLNRNFVPITDAEILILGAGGAVRGILEPLISQAPKRITIVNRRQIKAELIARDFKDLCDITIVDEQDLQQLNPTVIINATSETPEYMYKLNFKNTVCYDLNYIPKITQFMHIARTRGALRTCNGLGMLVEQAAAAFELWHNLRPDTCWALEHLQLNTGQKSAKSGL